MPDLEDVPVCLSADTVKVPFPMPEVLDKLIQELVVEAVQELEQVTVTLLAIATPNALNVKDVGLIVKVVVSAAL